MSGWLSNPPTMPVFYSRVGHGGAVISIVLVLTLAALNSFAL